MEKVGSHPCPYNIKRTGRCSATNNWWDGEPSDCDFTPEQLAVSRPGDEGYCSNFPGLYRNIDGTFIHPSQLRPLSEIAKGAEMLLGLLEDLKK